MATCVCVCVCMHVCERAFIAQTTSIINSHLSAFTQTSTARLSKDTHTHAKATEKECKRVRIHRQSRPVWILVRYTLAGPGEQPTKLHNVAPVGCAKLGLTQLKIAQEHDRQKYFVCFSMFAGTCACICIQYSRNPAGKIIAFLHFFSLQLSRYQMEELQLFP